MILFIKDKIKLILFSLLCALAAWGFWYFLDMAGFYVIGVILIASYSIRIWNKSYRS
ncbi:hypothetical protein [Vibrio neptunius]|uniref:Uncharacterized protein n=1 Tax=Vibrio neptunius TaxID=170651 RepID=A0ABS3A8W3_9VIBR|nr:hypothetical protein [Vibrio neptunius]MBN3495890.1 hypothetical protein [Vibrio neptunius]MBN3552644.1 hypothetical protein [Vibrio neptunius]MBN3580699.1 hypothetical protein [Vibrio neptunius]MCH9874365.1 hypothetical protein [Vibrio neptunius]